MRTLKNIDLSNGITLSNYDFVTKLLKCTQLKDNKLVLDDPDTFMELLSDKYKNSVIIVHETGLMKEIFSNLKQKQTAVSLNKPKPGTITKVRNMRLLNDDNIFIINRIMSCVNHNIEVGRLLDSMEVIQLKTYLSNFNNQCWFMLDTQFSRFLIDVLLKFPTANQGTLLKITIDNGPSPHLESSKEITPTTNGIIRMTTSSEINSILTSVPTVTEDGIKKNTSTKVLRIHKNMRVMDKENVAVFNEDNEDNEYNDKTIIDLRENTKSNRNIIHTLQFLTQHSNVTHPISPYPQEQIEAIRITLQTGIYSHCHFLITEEFDLWKQAYDSIKNLKGNTASFSYPKTLNFS